MNESGLRELCAAVVRTAIYDYRAALKYPNGPAAYYRVDCEHFFRRELSLYSDLDGENIMRLVREQVYGGKKK